MEQQKPKKLQHNSSIQLTNEQFETFCDTCENPPTPSEKLLKAALYLDQEGFTLKDHH